MYFINILGLIWSFSFGRTCGLLWPSIKRGDRILTFKMYDGSTKTVALCTVKGFIKAGWLILFTTTLWPLVFVIEAIEERLSNF